MSESLPIFDDFENLVKLDLSNNHLAHVSKAYFGKMKKLKVLRLNNNKITYLTSLAFHNLVEIEQARLFVKFKIIPHKIQTSSFELGTAYYRLTYQ